EVAAALVDWAHERRKQKQPEAAWRHLIDVANEADPDKFRLTLRKAMPARDLATLRKLGAGKLEDLPVASVSLLGMALRNAGDGEASIRWLKAAQLRYPKDLWINYELAESLSNAKPPRRAEALQYYRVVRSLRAEMGYLLALTLWEQKESAEAL